MPKKRRNLPPFFTDLYLRALERKKSQKKPGKPAVLNVGEPSADNKAPKRSRVRLTEDQGRPS